MYDLNWTILNIPISGEEQPILVAEFKHDSYVCYWVKLGGIFDVTVRPYGKEMTGIGATKYEQEIREAIRTYKSKILFDNIKWKYKDKKSIRVIKGKEGSNVH